MRQRIAEETVLFISVAKWICAAALVGAIVGLSTTVFIKILIWSSELAEHFGYYFLFLPVAMVLSVLLVKYIEPEAEGHGTEKVIEAIHKRSGKMKGKVVPVKLAATILTLAAGGSVGKEGPCAQIGAALASKVADLFRLSDQDRKKLVICGISAGFASVFGTPISGAIFGIEVLFAGTMLYEVLLPSFVAGIVGYQVSAALGVPYFYCPMQAVPDFHGIFFMQVLAAGVFFGFCACFLIESLKAGKRLSSKIRVSMPIKAFGAGLVLVVLTLVLSKQYLGLGLKTIESSLQGVGQPWYVFILKSIFTSITLSFGGSGGIVTPIFFVGAASGAFFATLLGLDVAVFSGIGLVSLLAGAANTPISASMMAVELFGPQLAPYAAVACILSYLITGHRSVYPSQILAVSKSASLEVEIGREMEGIQPCYKARDKTLIGTAAGLWDKIRNGLRNSRRP